MTQDPETPEKKKDTLADHVRKYVDGDDKLKQKILDDNTHQIATSFREWLVSA